MYRQSRNSRALTLYLLVSLAVAGCTASSPSPAPRLIGFVGAVEGSPSVVRSSQSYLVDKQSHIYEGDIIQTNGASRVHIRMLDDMSLEIGPHAHIIFHEYPVRGMATMTLASGSFKADLSTATSGRNVAVRTPLGVISGDSGVFLGGFFAGPNVLDVAMSEGRTISVHNKHGEVRIKSIGEGTTIIGGTAPQPPQIWSSRRLERARQETLINRPAIDTGPT